MRENRNLFLKPTYEKNLFSLGIDEVIGIDEAGRGPLAGPVFLAAFIFRQNDLILDSIKDSKLLSSKQRENTFFQIDPKKYFFLSKHNNEIDKQGIAHAIEDAISELISKIRSNSKKQKFLIDGIFKRKFDCDYELIIRGDKKVYSIATASIVAKVKRDETMKQYAKKFPEYKFEKHKGYGTKEHMQLIRKYGPCNIHRKSFKPISTSIEKISR